MFMVNYGQFSEIDLSRLEIKKVTGEIEITGGKNLLLTVNELKL